LIQTADNLINLSISIVNTSNWAYLQPCLESIKKNVKGINYEILVVDNVSTDGSVEKIREQFPTVILTVNQERYGFAKNNNINIKKSRGKFVMFLNDDTLVLPYSVEKALEVFELHTRIGVVGCKMINPDGSIQIASSRKFRTLLSEFIIEIGLFRLFPQIFIKPYAELFEIDVASEAGMLVRRETIKEVGMLDEEFFMFGEGPEWCRRIINASWKIFYYENCPIIHFGGTTNKRASIKMWVQFIKSTYLYFRKDKPLKGYIYRWMILTIVSSKRLVLKFLSNFSQRIEIKYISMKPYYEAVIEFLKNRIHEENYPFPV